MSSECEESFLLTMQDGRVANLIIRPNEPDGNWDYDVYVAGRCLASGWADDRTFALLHGRGSAAFVCGSAVVSVKTNEVDKERVG